METKKKNVTVIIDFTNERVPRCLYPQLMVVAVAPATLKDKNPRKS